MFCRNCGKKIPEKVMTCPECKSTPWGEKNFCNNCGAKTEPQQVICLKCGAGLSGINVLGGLKTGSKGIFSKLPKPFVLVGLAMLAIIAAYGLWFRSSRSNKNPDLPVTQGGRASSAPGASETTTPKKVKTQKQTAQKAAKPQPLIPITQIDQNISVPVNQEVEMVFQVDRPSDMEYHYDLVQGISVDDIRIVEYQNRLSAKAKGNPGHDVCEQAQSHVVSASGGCRLKSGKYVLVLFNYNSESVVKVKLVTTPLN